MTKHPGRPAGLASMSLPARPLGAAAMADRWRPARAARASVGRTMACMATPDRRPELDIEDAQRRMRAAAEEAKRLEDAGRGFAANAAWERYRLIGQAIAAQERRARAAARRAAS
jgi:hypothetical protein